jgi:hypothetical protein
MATTLEAKYYLISPDGSRSLAFTYPITEYKDLDDARGQARARGLASGKKVRALSFIGRAGAVSGFSVHLQK